MYSVVLQYFIYYVIIMITYLLKDCFPCKDVFTLHLHVY
jgi:hypothetical protein